MLTRRALVGWGGGCTSLQGPHLLGAGAGGVSQSPSPARHRSQSPRVWGPSLCTPTQTGYTENFDLSSNKENLANASSRVG